MRHEAQDGLQTLADKLKIWECRHIPIIDNDWVDILIANERMT